MRKKNSRPIDIPTTAQVAREKERLRYQKRYSRTLKSTVAILIVVAALAVLVATLWMPVLRIYGNSMVPTLEDGQIVISVKSRSYQSGDIVAFYYGNKLLTKRYIAGPSDWVDVDEDGNVLSIRRNYRSHTYRKKRMGKPISSCPIKCQMSDIL